MEEVGGRGIRQQLDFWKNSLKKDYLHVFRMGVSTKKCKRIF